MWTEARSGLLISMLKKTQLVLFDQSNNTSAIDVKISGSFHEKKNHLLRSWGYLSLQNWIRAFTFSLLLELAPLKLEPLFIL